MQMVLYLFIYFYNFVVRLFFTMDHEIIVEDEGIVHKFMCANRELFFKLDS